MTPKFLYSLKSRFCRMRLSFATLVTITSLFEFCESTFRYFLYDGGTDTWTQLPSNGIISDPLWDINSDVKVLIHGFNPNPKAMGMDVFDSHFMTILAQEYARYDTGLNILVVDWTSLATFPIYEYFSAVNNVKPAGEMIANYLVQLLQNGAIRELNSIHILGLSLGAHVAGAVGYEIKKLMGGNKVYRITGLDPAGPGFSTSNGKWPDDISTLLDYSDADFVDIIHTNIGRPPLEPLLTGALGTDLQTGHVDIYPNGGKAQKYQCSLLADRLDGCSHEMSVLFYAQALRQPFIYTACPCSSYRKFLRGYCSCTYMGKGILLGDLTTPAPHGKYYMTIMDPLSVDTFA